MTMENSHRTPPEWWEQQAQEDLITAKVLLSAGRFYAAAFFAHQAAEKAIKSVIIRRGQEMPYTHSLERLVSVCQVPSAVREAALDLAPEYGKAKCPYHAGGVPANLYDEARAIECIGRAELVLNWALDESVRKPHSHSRMKAEG